MCANIKGQELILAVVKNTHWHINSNNDPNNTTASKVKCDSIIRVCSCAVFGPKQRWDILFCLAPPLVQSSAVFQSSGEQGKPDNVETEQPEPFRPRLQPSAGTQRACNLASSYWSVRFIPLSVLMRREDGFCGLFLRTFRRLLASTLVVSSVIVRTLLSSDNYLLFILTGGPFLPVWTLLACIHSCWLNSVEPCHWGQMFVTWPSCHRRPLCRPYRELLVAVGCLLAVVRGPSCWTSTPVLPTAPWTPTTPS